ncbi:hypothetical protein H920_12219 [Fukomys damarensis]|uniref:Uncharacterized protein n=1 Tax=Fukomys damarensis TaxID=885580 RepID=A0A091D5T3_FUKDA|nr:hypothetical protein H920_12219 [Fukomys damarensis]
MCKGRDSKDTAKTLPKKVHFSRWKGWSMTDLRSLILHVGIGLQANSPHLPQHHQNTVSMELHYDFITAQRSAVSLPSLVRYQSFLCVVSFCAISSNLAVIVPIYPSSMCLAGPQVKIGATVYWDPSRDITIFLPGNIQSQEASDAVSSTIRGPATPQLMPELSEKYHLLQGGKDKEC